MGSTNTTRVPCWLNGVVSITRRPTGGTVDTLLQSQGGNRQDRAPRVLRRFRTGDRGGLLSKIHQRRRRGPGVIRLWKGRALSRSAPTIPRLELCAAVLAAEITQLIKQEKVFSPGSITYYSDSKVVLGYITNESRRFYVSNR